MNRRVFLSGLVATASGLLVPEPVKAYSFVGGWAKTEGQWIKNEPPIKPLSGDWLDWFAYEYWNIKRFPTETDQSLRRRIVNSHNALVASGYTLRGVNGYSL